MEVVIAATIAALSSTLAAWWGYSGKRTNSREHGTVVGRIDRLESCVHGLTADVTHIRDNQTSILGLLVDLSTRRESRI
jgi:hypothetical protein